MPLVLEFRLKPYLWFSASIQPQSSLVSNVITAPSLTSSDTILGDPTNNTDMSLALQMRNHTTGTVCPNGVLGGLMADSRLIGDSDALSASDSDNSNSGAPSNMGLFSRLPSELRTMIWKATLTLKSDEGFSRPITPQRTIMVQPTSEVTEINSALLRTCRSIHHEALPILYRYNWLHFDSAAQIEEFRSRRLPKPNAINSNTHRIFGFKPEFYGRLTLLRLVYLTFAGAYMSGPWQPWAGYFEPQEKEQESLAFPALEKLILDFRLWRLNPENEIRVSCIIMCLSCMLTFFLNQVEPFLRKLRPEAGLALLGLYGVQNERNIRDFKLGFVKHGGLFTGEPEASEYKDAVVTHDDIPLASKCVRAFLQEKRL